MLRVGIDLDQSKPEMVSHREVKVGENFDVIVMLWDDGKGDSPVFDTFVSEIWFNDKGAVVSLDLSELPLAGDLADNSHTTVDAFSLKNVFSSDTRFKGGGPGLGTPLTRPDATIEPAGLRSSVAGFWRTGRKLQVGYSEASGRAGLSDFENPFKLSPDLGKIAAVKGRASARKDARGIAPGETNLYVSMTAFLGSQPVPLISEVSTIRVIDPFEERSLEGKENSRLNR